MRILCLVDWPEKGKWIWDYLPPQEDQVDFHILKSAPDIFAGYGKFITYYPYYFFQTLGVLRKLKDYDVILAYDGKNGVPIAFLKALIGFRHPRLIVLSFSVRGPIARIPGLLRFAMSSVDCVTYVSRGEMEYSNGYLKLPGEKIRLLLQAFTPRSEEEAFMKADGSDHKRYIFASGRSFRDYATLFEAVRGLDVEVVVNTRPFCIKGLDIPENVRINDILPREQYYRLMANALFVVVPLQSTPHGAGESHLVETMAARKAIVVTRNPSTVHFVDHGENGLLVQPGDVRAMRESIEFLLAHPAQTRLMGERRYQMYKEKWTFESYAQNVVDLIHEVCDTGLVSVRQ